MRVLCTDGGNYTDQWERCGSSDPDTVMQRHEAPPRQPPPPRLQPPHPQTRIHQADQYLISSEVRKLINYITNIFVYKIFSNFPHDIIKEISQISFTNFNSKNGSYQKLIPSVAHHFLFQQAVFRSDY